MWVAKPFAKMDNEDQTLDSFPFTCQFLMTDAGVVMKFQSERNHYFRMFLQKCTRFYNEQQNTVKNDLLTVPIFFFLTFVSSRTNAYGRGLQ